MSTDYISDCCGADCHIAANNSPTRWFECEQCNEPCNTVRADAPVLVRLREKLARVEAVIPKHEKHQAWWGNRRNALVAQQMGFILDDLRKALDEPKEEKKG